MSSIQTNCDLCAHGPVQDCVIAGCDERNSDFRKISNRQLLEKLADPQLADFFVNAPYVANLDYWENWLAAEASDEMIKKYF